MSRRISHSYPMGDLGCKNQIKIAPDNDKACEKIMQARALLLPDFSLDGELRRFIQMYPDLDPCTDMKEVVLNQWQPNNKPWRIGITCCIELQHHHERWLSKFPFTVNDVLYCYNDAWSASRFYVIGQGPQGKPNRKFIGPFYSGASRPLKDVDRIPYEIKSIRKLLGTHQSERGWNLPRSHRCHLLSFPKEILTLIFAYTLVAEGGAVVTPAVVTSNWDESYSEADYRISFPDSPHYKQSGSDVVLRKNIGPRPGIPDSSPYVELTRVLRPLIDATCLRSCKYIWKLGSQMLYADNAYSFKMNGTEITDCPPSLIFEGGDYHRPSPEKPTLSQEGISDGSTDKDLSAREYESKIERVINQLERRVPILELEGWAYYDPFIRFLYTIGPQNRASIRTLRFTGAPKTHVREAHGRKETCVRYGYGLLHIHGSVGNVIRSFDEVLIPFLGELEKLQTVRDLVMRRRILIYPKDRFDRRTLYEDIDYAKDTINSLRNRVENNV
ncbi:uncharacterized protein EAF02_006583 [Botrytis sinoallii]|uniref:uncharacterized protein n=1 Tax=Botrytis sinoallii TaxID=1463999 RepID=UPI001901D3B9|nr:uncharacterized protein EAF02_006583 [Botrytis sinoallii]KAF7881895.1 hypothetical protein EAF02_006583 [Botrytis sinoallii]